MDLVILVRFIHLLEATFTFSFSAVIDWSTWWMGSNGYMMMDGIQRIYDGGWDHKFKCTKCQQQVKVRQACTIDSMDLYRTLSVH
jgi:hypothetical protein